MPVPCVHSAAGMALFNKLAHGATRMWCAGCCFAAGAGVSTGTALGFTLGKKEVDSLKTEVSSLKDEVDSLKTEVDWPDPVMYHDHTKRNPEWLRVRNLGKGALLGSISFRSWSAHGADCPETKIDWWLHKKGVHGTLVSKFHVLFDETLHIAPYETRDILCVKPGKELSRIEADVMSKALADLRVDIDYSNSTLPGRPRKHYTAPQICP